MRGFWSDRFVWRFAGGFALGAVAVVAMQPAQARHELAGRLSHHQPRG